MKEARLRHLNRSETVVVERKTPVREVLRKMQETHSGGVLIIDQNGRLAGIFTERDYLDKLALPEFQSRAGVGLDSPIEGIMTGSPRSLSPDDTLRDAIRLMTEGGYRHIPMVEANGKVFGLLAASDAVQYIAEHFPAEVYNLPPRLHQSIRTPEGG